MKIINKLLKAISELKLIQQGKLPKKTWKELRKELSENND